MKHLKPTTPGQRGTILSDFSGLVRSARKKKLVFSINRFMGRSRGRITVRHHGGGAKRLYRLVDFLQNKFDIPGRIVQIEYDPNRSAFIAYVQYADGEKRYVLATEHMKAGDEIISSQKKIVFKDGNRMPLKHITVGTFVNTIEIHPGGGGKLARSAGTYAKILAHEGGRIHLVTPSSEVRMVPEDCLATIGVISNISRREEVLGKAGRTRHRGIRPTVRGTAMNPVDHPHGGGEGRAPIGMAYPKTPWGKHALGVKTRKRNKYSNRFILQRRKKKSE